MSKVIKARNLEVLGCTAKSFSQAAFSQEEANLLYEETREIVQELILEGEKKAQEILDRAQKEKEMILLEAQEKGNDIHAQAYKQGFEEGFAQGEEEGRSKLKSLQKEAEDHIKQAHQTRKEILDDVEEEIIKLSFLIGEKIIKKKILEEDVLREIALDVLGFAKNSEFVVLKANEDGVKELNQDIDELANIVAPGELRIDMDNSLGAGEVIVFSQIGIIEARIEPQLQKLKEALMEVKLSD